MNAQLVGYDNRQRLTRSGGRARIGFMAVGADHRGKLILFDLERAPCFRQDLFNRAICAGLYCCGQSAFNERGFTEMHIGLLCGIKELQCHFCTHDRTAQVHEYDDTVIAVNRLNGRVNPHGVSADGVFCVVNAPRSRNRNLALRHLLGQFADALSQFCAVRYDHQSDHGGHSPCFTTSASTLNR